MEKLAEFEARIARTIDGDRRLTPFPSNPSNGLVLVVDDESANRRLISMVLRNIDMRTVEAADGFEACALIQQTRPDVVLLDVMLPGIDGFEVCRRIKSRPETVNIPVLMISGLRHREMIYRGMAAGADGFINKPLDMQEVALRVRTALRTNGNRLRIPDLIGIPNDLEKLVPKRVNRSMRRVVGTLAKVTQSEEVPERIRKETGLATAAAGRITAMTDGILEIERLKEDAVTLERKPVLLRSILLEALDVFGDQLDVICSAGEEVLVVCQPTIVVQALVKLIGNARGRDRGRPRILISASEVGERVEIQVRLAKMGGGREAEAEPEALFSGEVCEEKDFDDEVTNRLVLAYCIAAFAAQGGDVGGCGDSFFFTLASGGGPNR